MLTIGKIECAIFFQVHQGVKNSPYAIRQNGIIPDLVSMGHDVKDCGNLQQEKLDNVSIKERYEKQGSKNSEEVATFNEKVSPPCMICLWGAF